MLLRGDVTASPPQGPPVNAVTGDIIPPVSTPKRTIDRPTEKD